MQHGAKLVLRYEGKPWQALDPCGGYFPDLLQFEGNIDYIRGVIAKTINYTRLGEDYELVDKLSDTSDYFKYQKQNIKKPETIPSHKVIENHIKEFGSDYRFEVKKHPIPELQDRSQDNITLARKKD